MRPRGLFATIALLLGASLVEAQTTTADGVDAWVRGDYDRAAEILLPLAGPAQTDPVAAFFLGTLYESGRGVPRDTVRACALYSRATDVRMPPFDRLASEWLQSIQTSIDFKQLGECDRLSTIGFDHGFQPLTFTLGPGHSISVDADGATITYQTKETRLDLSLGLPGVVFLPARHTALTTGRPQGARRDFIEFFMWEPNPSKGVWSLTWLLFEVLRDELVPIASDELTTTSSARPPIDLRIDEMAHVRLNDAGDAEWAVLIGDNPHAEVIETEAEKQETSRQNEARRAAERAVDWTRALDLDRIPTLAYADGDGCANVFVYGWSADRAEMITLRADKNMLQLSTVPRTFDLASQSSAVELLVHVFERPTPSPFCTDVRTATPLSEQWRAIGGTVTIALSAPGVRAGAPFLYRATIPSSVPSL